MTTKTTVTSLFGENSPQITMTVRRRLGSGRYVVIDRSNRQTMADGDGKYHPGQPVIVQDGKIIARLAAVQKTYEV